MDDPRQENARQLRAERAFKRKEDGAQAMSEYEAEGNAVRAKTARLKAQQLQKRLKRRVNPRLFPQENQSFQAGKIEAGLS